MAAEDESSVNRSALETNIEGKDTTTDTPAIELKNIGDSQIISQDDGSILYLILADQHEEIVSVLRTGTQRKSTKTYLIKEKNILGQEKTVVAISATGVWMEDGSDSYIISFSGDYTIYDDSFWCKWQDDLKHETDLYCTWVLDVAHGHTVCSYMLNGVILPVNGNLDNRRLVISIENYACS